jgi:hypothetical protein
MDHPKVAATCLALALAALPGCASLRWSLQKAGREQGARLTAFPEEVASEYACAQRALPFLAVEQSEIVPPRVHPGEEFNHRLVYALCPERPTGVVAGRLVEGIRFRGELLHREVRDGFELRPGRWVLDAFIELPGGAEPGVYAYELRFEGGRVGFEQRHTFVVDPR